MNRPKLSGERPVLPPVAVRFTCLNSIVHHAQVAGKLGELVRAERIERAAGLVAHHVLDLLELGGGVQPGHLAIICW